MTKVYTSAVVIIPPEDIWSPIQTIRSQYDRQIHRWMPHIMLLYPFRPEDQFNNLETKFSEVCSQINSFTITLSRFKYFEHRHKNFTLWLDPEPNRLIQKLQFELLKIVPDCNDVNKFKDGFHPHLSVGQIQGISKLKITLHDLQKSWKDITFNVNDIYFISRENEKKSRFEIVETIQLKQ